MPAPTASPTVSSTVGLKNMVIAPLTEDPEEGTTYGTLQAVAAAIEATIPPERADTEVPYAADQYFAVGFMSEKANHKCRCVWLYKVRAKPMTETYKTKEGATITRQNGSVEWTAIKRTSDGRYQAVADEGENGFDSTKAATFLQSVYEPTFTPEEDGP